MVRLQVAGVRGLGRTPEGIWPVALPVGDERQSEWWGQRHVACVLPRAGVLSSGQCVHSPFSLREEAHSPPAGTPFVGTNSQATDSIYLNFDI